MSTKTLLPWKVAFRVQFVAPKFGLKFKRADEPNTGNGIYTVCLSDSPDVTKKKSEWGPAEHYNAMLKPDQQHLALRQGLYITHINDDHLIDLPCEEVISRLKQTSRPVQLRFIDVEAGTAQLAELQRVGTPRMLISSDPEADNPNANKLSSAQSWVKNNLKSESKGPASSSPSLLSNTKRTHSPSPAPASNDEIYKVILVGSCNVGKSSILAVCVDGDEAYQDRRPTTLEAEFGSIEVPSPDISSPDKKINVRIWDTAGQERYRSVTRSHYRRTDGAILVYDVSQPKSFEELKVWLRELREAAGDTLASILIVENKADLLPQLKTGKETRPKKFVDENKVAEFCSKNGFLFARTTAKQNAVAYKWEGQKVHDAVNKLILHVHATKLSRGMKSNEEAISLNSGTGKIKSSDCASCS